MSFFMLLVTQHFDVVSNRTFCTVTPIPSKNDQTSNYMHNVRLYGSPSRFTILSFTYYLIIECKIKNAELSAGLTILYHQYTQHMEKFGILSRRKDVISQL